MFFLQYGIASVIKVRDAEAMDKAKPEAFFFFCQLQSCGKLSPLFQSTGFYRDNKTLYVERKKGETSPTGEMMIQSN